VEEVLNDLMEWLRIPSVSALPEFAGSVREAAEFTAKLFDKAGLERVRLIEGNGFPLVYGEWLHAEGKPTLLCYGHYDVQPAEPYHLWNTPPFEPTLVGVNLHARGAADDKGLAIILIKAVEHYLAKGMPLPVNVKFLFEGEEESGGDHISSYLKEHAEALRADAVLICDTEMFAPELPTICVGLRGIVYGEMQVETGATDLHSGVYGGTVPNAILAAAQIVTTLKDAAGRVNVAGFYDGIEEPSEAEKGSWAQLPFDEERYRSEEAQVFALTGEPDFDVFERTWSRPTLEVHGIRGGFVGEGSKTVIPCEALVKLSCRLVPGQDPEDLAAKLAQAIADAAPVGAKASLRILGKSKAALVDPENRFVREAALAMEEVFGAKTVFTRSGGSIPIVGLMLEHLKIPSVLMGFGLPDDNLHAPNEKVYLPNVYRGVEAVALYLERLGR
jgi:acetylornithine deacetylase/succinyl-diaminopimelate desuccinylase-like protein